MQTKKSLSYRIPVENTHEPPSYRLRLAFIQPSMAPYRRPLFEIISAHPNVDLKVFVITDPNIYRKGWQLKPDEKFDVEVAGPIRLARRVVKFQPDAVICTNAAEFLYLLPVKLLRRCYIGAWAEDTLHTASQYKRWRQWFRAFIYRRMDFFVASGNQTIEYLRKIGIPDERITHCMSSVDNHIYTSKPRSLARRKNEHTQWITVGSLITRKGFSELLQAWDSQNQEFLASNRLIIVGEGPEEKKLSQLIQQMPSCKIDLVGFRTPDELSDLYAESDMYIFPTLLDHWGLVVNEAMASGLPIVCSKYAGCCSDLVTPNNGIIINPVDTVAFANAIYGIWGKRDQWEEMGKESKRIISSYTLDATANAVIRAVKFIIKKQ